MKVAVTAKEDKLSSEIDPRFGRATVRVQAREDVWAVPGVVWAADAGWGEDLVQRITQTRRGIESKDYMMMESKVEAVIDKIRPMLARDGGDISLVSVKDGVVTVELKGACKGCAMSRITLKQGVEKVLKNEIPDIKKVENIG